MTFAADKHRAVFGDENGSAVLFAEEYEISRTAAAGETVLLCGTVSLYNGGGKALRIKLRGTSAKPCAAFLDGLLTSGAAVALKFEGMTFERVVLTDYKCSGKSGESEKVYVEFAKGSDASDTSGEEDEV